MQALSHIMHHYICIPSILGLGDMEVITHVITLFVFCLRGLAHRLARGQITPREHKGEFWVIGLLASKCIGAAGILISLTHTLTYIGYLRRHSHAPAHTHSHAPAHTHRNRGKIKLIKVDIFRNTDRKIEVERDCDSNVYIS